MRRKRNRFSKPVRLSDICRGGLGDVSRPRKGGSATASDSSFRLTLCDIFVT